MSYFFTEDKLEVLSSRIEEFTLELTRQLSVVGTKGEIEIPYKVYKILGEFPYFKANPHNLFLLPIDGDGEGRHDVVAVLEGKKDENNKCVALIGHMDTVGISDYGDLKEYANKPEELIKELSLLELSKEVRADLESGDYIFGRGIFDMKVGVAILMAILEMLSAEPEKFSGNLVFGGVCDEEANSAGMIALVPELVRLKKERGFDYLALLDTDYMTDEYEGDINKYIYVGTVGKLMPTFFIRGKETHVGEPFKGLDPNQIAAEITARLNLNPEFCDVAEGESTLPPITLKQRDLKTEYSVQIAKTALLFVNYATHSVMPDQVLREMIDMGRECFQNVTDSLQERYKVFCKIARRPYAPLPWRVRVISYQELCNLVREEVGEQFDDLLEAFATNVSLDPSVDDRDKNTKLVEYVESLWSNKDPIIVVYFSQPYYPHVYVKGETDKEKQLLKAVEGAVEEVKADQDIKYNIVYKKFFPYISDLSYGSAPKDNKVVSMFKDNMPGYGTLYNLPFEEMQDLDLPVLDIGAYGKDAHKFTERIEKNYSFKVAPLLVAKTIFNLLGGAR